jgi:hypothetical protein
VSGAAGLDSVLMASPFGKRPPQDWKGLGVIQPSKTAGNTAELWEIPPERLGLAGRALRGARPFFTVTTYLRQVGHRAGRASRLDQSRASPATRLARRSRGGLSTRKYLSRYLPSRPSRRAPQALQVISMGGEGDSTFTTL